MMHPTLVCDRCGATNRSQLVHCRVCGYSLQAGTSTIYHSVTGQLPAMSMLKLRYRIITPVGKGGMGAVYQAEDTQLGDRQVALKEMSQSGLNPQKRKHAADIFRQEATILARLQHPNLPSIFDHFEENGHWYLVMTFIKGETFANYLRRAQGGKLPLDEVLQIGIQLCTVLGYLHSQQPPIIFRDLKPSNIMRAPDGHLYLIDFGIARHFKPGQAKDTAPYGSMGYAPPEQYGRAQTTPRSDIYSLGVTLYQMLSGNDPSHTSFHFSPLQLLGQSPSFAELTTLITSMLDGDVQKRPVSVAVVKQTLERIVNQLLYSSQPPNIISTVPPSPPSNLQVRVGNPTINLQWLPSSTHNVKYKIVRKTSSQPVSVDDGELLDTVPGCVYNDMQPEVGIPIFYAVFAAFADITSADAARHQRPVLLLADVTNVNARVDDHLVELCWQAPPHAHAVVVVRKEKTPPNSLNDGKRLTLQDLSHVVDRDVENGCLYYYAIYSQFKAYDGSVVTSDGIIGSATPVAPQKIISQGAPIPARQVSKIVVTYEVVRSRPLFGAQKRLLHIHSHTQGILPTLLLVSQQGRLPITKGDGNIVYRLAGPVPIRSHLQFELPDKPCGPDLFGRLFLEDDDKSGVVTINMPSKDKLRLT